MTQEAQENYKAQELPEIYRAYEAQKDKISLRLLS